MDRAGILSGSLLIVDRSYTAQDADIVAVYHLGERLIRRLRKQCKRYFLVNESLDETEIILEVTEDTILW